MLSFVSFCIFVYILGREGKNLVLRDALPVSITVSGLASKGCKELSSQHMNTRPITNVWDNL